MWFIVHFYMIYLLQPNFSFHMWSMMFFLIYMITHMKWEDACSKKTLTSSIGLFLMYMGMKLFNSLIEFCFVPYYVISLYGLRNRYMYIFISSIILGLHLYRLKTIQIIGHLCMNIGRMIKQNTIPSICFFMIHWIMAVISYIFFNEKSSFVNNFIAAISSIICFYFERMDHVDLFCTSMIFSASNSWNFFKVIIVQILEMDWFHYYQNNHFMYVYNSYTFIIPVGVLIFCLFYE